MIWSIELSHLRPHPPNSSASKPGETIPCSYFHHSTFCTRGEAYTLKSRDLGNAQNYNYTALSVVSSLRGFCFYYFFLFDFCSLFIVPFGIRTQLFNNKRILFVLNRKSPSQVGMTIPFSLPPTANPPPAVRGHTVGWRQWFRTVLLYSALWVLCLVHSHP